jgi:hypothetical protein
VRSRDPICEAMERQRPFWLSLWLSRGARKAHCRDNACGGPSTTSHAPSRPHIDLTHLPQFTSYLYLTLANTPDGRPCRDLTYPEDLTAPWVAPMTHASTLRPYSTPLSRSAIEWTTLSSGCATLETPWRLFGGGVYGQSAHLPPTNPQVTHRRRLARGAHRLRRVTARSELANR